MHHRVRSLSALAAIALAIGASLYVVWHAADAGRTSPSAEGGIDWAAALEGLPDEGFERPSGPWRPVLPADHGAHSQTRTETWILTAHLHTGDGERVGIELALLRVALVPPDAPRRDSAWAARHVYRGHVTLVTEARGRALGEERFSRVALGLAGHDAAQRRIWLEDWSIHYGEGTHDDRLRVEAGIGDVAVELVLTPGKPAVTATPDEGGAPFRGFALTRLKAEGAVRRPGGRQLVSGLAWLDHLWGDVPLPAGPVVWDRLQLHLDDGTDLSLVRTRRRGGSGQPSAEGYLVDARGDVERLASASTTMEPTRAWRSEGGGARYPLHWQVSAGGVELDVAPLVDDQVHDFTAPIWSGLVTTQGRASGRTVSGAGYLELTGYESR